MRTCNDCKYFDFITYKCSILLREVKPNKESCIVFDDFYKGMLKTEIHDIEPKAKIYADFMKGVNK